MVFSIIKTRKSSNNQSNKTQGAPDQPLYIFKALPFTEPSLHHVKNIVYTDLKCLFHCISEYNFHSTHSQHVTSVSKVSLRVLGQ